MSYILEALKKAQAERSSGQIPSVHAQPLAPPAPDFATKRSGLLTGVAALVGTGAALAAAWFFFMHEAPSPAVKLAGSAAPQQMQQTERQPPLAAPAVAPAIPATAAHSPVPGTPAVKPDPVPARKAAPPADKPQQVAALQDLPPQIQREIPTVAINGYIYASNPAERSVLINNQLRREGQQVAPGLTLEKLLPKEMVLNYRGYRYRIAY